MSTEQAVRAEMVGDRSAGALAPTDRFVDRHVGPGAAEVERMLGVVGAPTLESFIDSVVPEPIRVRRALALDEAMTEAGAQAELRRMASRNQVMRSCIGMGYHGTVTPPAIRRHVLENPSWYTQYTPYQAEISQGRLEMLLTFQTMICELTGLPLANASLLDEGTAAAEAMAMCVGVSGGVRPGFFVADDCHPQTIEVVRTRASSMGIDLTVAPIDSIDLADPRLAGFLVQVPTTDGRVECYEELTRRAHEHGVMAVAAADPLALMLLRPPGAWGADVCVGSTQRFGVPMGFGGPHAAYFATREEHARRMPGRLVGVSRDAHGRRALRLALQTREQHIKRERATSNICTAQVLPAVIATAYAVYHGPGGLRRIAQRVRALAQTVRVGLSDHGHQIGDDLTFDTLRVRPVGRDAQAVIGAAVARGINLRDFGDGTVGVTLDETGDERLIADLLAAFGGTGDEDVGALSARADLDLPQGFERAGAVLAQTEFNTYHTETELMRYLTELSGRDLSLTHSMIPLGSCTMKLNAAAEMEPISWSGFADLHPYAPASQAQGYGELVSRLERQLAEITGLAAVSVQPNAGSQGEYAGLLAIRAYHESRGEGHRDVCLIPESAHGTNPASAIIAGWRVVSIKGRADGWVDLDDLRTKAAAHERELAALMITYPSTCGVFEDHVREVCAAVHAHGGQVYMDGANMNAQVGLTSPGACGADVCHLNLHKTFCIPHGGGGPGVGPIAVREHLRPFLPGSVSRHWASNQGHAGAVSSAPHGSASILPISWAYVAMMGPEGLRHASEIAILNANYMAARLRGHYGLLFGGATGRVAHEFVIDCRPFKKSAGVEIDDIAKRLMDYGFHAPTMSWPVPGTLMIEPTESESLDELDRLCDALISIRAEIARVERGEWTREDNPLKHAPHTVEAVCADRWTHAYSREVAAFPAPHLRRRKFWASVGRVDNPYGDRNLVCTCPSVEESEGA